MRKIFLVALLIESSNVYSRELLRGISTYMHEQANWSVTLHENNPPYEHLLWSGYWKGDGVIARIVDSKVARQLKPARIPMINVSGGYHVRGISDVGPDHGLVAQVALEHLRDCGLDQVAYCGDDRFAWSLKRKRFFQKHARDCGLDPILFTSRLPPQASWMQINNEIRDWLKSLPQPIGVMASHDFRGQQLIEICKQEGIAVPEQIAVIGVDNDELICNLCEPRMSSVILDAFETGYQAAALLAATMRDPSLPPTIVRIPPRGIVARQSTDIVVAEDQRLVRALQLIREQACQGLTAAAVVRSSGVSRGTLEACFHLHLGRTIREEIERIRIDKIKHLLRETLFPLEKIAAVTGFQHPEYLSVMFKRAVGMSPGQYRQARRPFHE